MRRRLTGTLTVLAATSVTATACTVTGGEESAAPPEEPNSEFSLPQDIVERGLIRNAVNAPFPPFEEKNADGTFEGFDIDLMDAISEKLGIPIEIVEIETFGGLIPALQADRVDMILSGLSDSEERREAVSFVDYFFNYQTIVTTEENPLGLETAEDLCGATIGIQTGWISSDRIAELSDQCVSDGREPMELPNFQNASEGIVALGHGRIDGFASGYASAVAFQQTSADAGVPLSISVTLPEDWAAPYGIAIGKDDEQLAEALQQALVQMQEDGTYQELLEKYDLTDGGLEEITINRGMGF